MFEIVSSTQIPSMICKSIVVTIPSHRFDLFGMLLTIKVIQAMLKALAGMWIWCRQWRWPPWYANRKIDQVNWLIKCQMKQIPNSSRGALVAVLDEIFHLHKSMIQWSILKYKWNISCFIWLQNFKNKYLSQKCMFSRIVIQTRSDPGHNSSQVNESHIFGKIHQNPTDNEWNACEQRYWSSSEFVHQRTHDERTHWQKYCY